MGKLTATASGPLGDTLAYRLSGNMHQRDGYYDNAAVDDQNADNYYLDQNLDGNLSSAEGKLVNIRLSLVNAGGGRDVFSMGVCCLYK